MMQWWQFTSIIDVWLIVAGRGGVIYSPWLALCVFLVTVITMVAIGITMGCPVGIGPEIILSCVVEGNIPPDIQPVVVGDLDVLLKTAAELGWSAPFVAWQPGESLPSGHIPVLHVAPHPLPELAWGCPNAATGSAMAEYIKTAVSLTQRGFFQGLATCPIAKTSLNKAGYSFPGHTEMLASMTHSNEYAMMMAGSRLRVTLVTVHRPLKEVAAALTAEAILRMIRITHTALVRDFGITHPRLAVAGFNPHAGEDGLFGDEESRFIAPAIAQARLQGMDVNGPFPPDTVYYKAAAGTFDAVVSMYHDQGLIPFKLLHFDDGVNVTLGLPIIRTSVDHGTAYDIAGKGLANHASLAAAIRMAAMISTNRTHFDGK